MNPPTAKPTRPLTLAALLATGLLAAPTLPAQRASARGSQTLGTLLIAAADTDRDGIVTTTERDAFLATFPAPPQPIEQFTLLARLLHPQADLNDDGQITRDDLAGTFERLDTNRDDRIERPERNNLRGTDVSVFDAIFAKAADQNTDGTTTATEWQAFLTTLPATGTPVTTDTLATWLRTASSAEDADRTAFTPSVWLLTIDAGLDVDGDGRRTKADFTRAFADLDFDADGDIDRADRQAARRAARDRARSSTQTNPTGELPRGHLPPAAITDADRAAPCLVPFQRNLDDALALSRATGKPLLLCVNMDGETASEQLAWRYYRDPDFAALTDRYIPLIASPDDHTPRSFDDHGRRLPGARFGHILDEEHQAIEPILFDRYFQGRRVAPRHVGVTADGEILFDLFLVADLNRIADTLAQHGKETLRRAESTVEQLLQSPDATHREALEARFATLPLATRLDLTHRALSGDVRHTQLIRQALLDPAPQVRLAAVETLATDGHLAEVDLYVPARREAAGHPALIATLVDRLFDVFVSTAPAPQPTPTAAEVKGITTRPDPARIRLARIAYLQGALNTRSTLIDVPAWHRALAGQPARPLGVTADDLDRLDRELGLLQSQKQTLGPDAAHTPRARDLSLRQARTTLEFAQALLLQSGDPGLYFDDVRRLAAAAVDPTAVDPTTAAAHTPHNTQAEALQAYASHMLRDPTGAIRHATAALPGLATPDHAPSWLAHELLVLFTKTRTTQLYQSLEADEPFPAHYVADVHAAYQALLRHPLRTEADYSACLDWLDVVGDWATEAALYPQALQDFPLAAPLHERFRGQLLRDAGADALELAYLDLPATPSTRAGQDWFAGLASLLAAERHVQNDPQTQHPDPALAAYRRSADLFRASVAREPSYESSAAHWICLAQAGQARLLLTTGNLPAAAAALQDACQTAPQSTTWQDGLGNTPAQTAGLLLQRLRATETEDATELADDLEQRLEELAVTPEFPQPAGR